MKDNSAQVMIPLSQGESDVTPPYQKDSLAILSTVVHAAREAKGIDIKVLDIRGLSDVANFLVIMSGRSDRHVQGLSHRVLDECSKEQLHVISVEGLDKAQWVLADLGDVILHVFYEPLRTHYDLESLWIKAPKVEM